MGSPRRLRPPFSRTAPHTSLSHSLLPCPFPDCIWNWKSIRRWARCLAMSHWSVCSCTLLNPGFDLNAKTASRTSTTCRGPTRAGKYTHTLEKQVCCPRARESRHAIGISVNLSTLLINPKDIEGFLSNVIRLISHLTIGDRVGMIGIFRAEDLLL